MAELLNVIEITIDKARPEIALCCFTMTLDTDPAWLRMLRILSPESTERASRQLLPDGRICTRMTLPADRAEVIREHCLQHSFKLSKN